MHTYLKIHPDDNLLVALQDLPKGTVIHADDRLLTLVTDVAAKHKFALQGLAADSPVYLYGVLVGKATQAIAAGEAVTPFNLKHEADDYGVENRQPYSWQAPDVSAWEARTFNGYVRSDGRVGTRNYWLVVPLVFCENRNIRMMQDAFEHELGYAQPETYRVHIRRLIQNYQSGQPSGSGPRLATETIDETSAGATLFPNLDGIRFLTHEMGCGGTNDDSDRLCELLAGCIVNPNVVGATVLSLGCQKSQIDRLRAEIQKRSPGFDRPLLYFDQQTYGTEAAMLADAIQQTFDGLAITNELRRQPMPLSKLTVGLKCGGSDGFSGISANPALGYVSDLLVTLGGTTLLAEFPELCGVEQQLIDRCQNEADAERFIQLMGDYARQAAAVGADFAMNPSVGNIKDGLITDAIKSAGAAKKGGNAPISGVLDYAQLPTQPGLHLLCTPGNDVLATTAMAASGANLIVFTTGLGTPTGNPITPTVKVSTNSRLAHRMPDIIDFDTGSIISGQATIAQTGQRMVDELIAIASGTRKTKSEQLGQNDFIPWQRGINL